MCFFFLTQFLVFKLWEISEKIVVVDALYAKHITLNLLNYVTCGINIKASIGLKQFYVRVFSFIIKQQNFGPSQSGPENTHFWPNFFLPPGVFEVNAGLRTMPESISFLTKFAEKLPYSASLIVMNKRPYCWIPFWIKVFWYYFCFMFLRTHADCAIRITCTYVKWLNKKKW